MTYFRAIFCFDRLSRTLSIAVTALSMIISASALVKISGGFDYICKFVVKDITHYQFIIEGLLKKNNQIKHYYSYVVTHTPIIKNVDIRQLI